VKPNTSNDIRTKEDDQTHPYLYRPNIRRILYS